jgi:hypothetical protein
LEKPEGKILLERPGRTREGGIEKGLQEIGKEHGLD